MVCASYAPVAILVKMLRVNKSKRVSLTSSWTRNKVISVFLCNHVHRYESTRTGHKQEQAAHAL